jgi:hypothetical protein
VASLFCVRLNIDHRAVVQVTDPKLSFALSAVNGNIGSNPAAGAWARRMTASGQKRSLAETILNVRFPIRKETCERIAAAHDVAAAQKQCSVFWRAFLFGQAPYSRFGEALMKRY